MASTSALGAEHLGELGEQLGSRDGRRVHRHLVGTRVEHRLGVLDRPHAAADRERDEDVVGAAAQLGDGLALLVRCRDVEEDDLVCALVLVAHGELDGIPRVAQVHELDALHHAALVHVEARDHAGGASALERLLALAHAEAALVERLARDHAGEFSIRSDASARRSSTEPIPPE